MSVAGLVPEGMVQTEIRNLSKMDTLQRTVEKLGLLRGQLDRFREERNS